MAKKVQTGPSRPCVNIDPTSSLLKLEGLGLNEKICYDRNSIQAKYLQCPDSSSSRAAEDRQHELSTVVFVVGICLGSVAVLANIFVFWITFPGTTTTTTRT